MDVLKGFNWVVVLGIVVAIETQIGNGSMSLTNMVPEAWIPYVKAWAANLGSIGALIMSAGAFGPRPQGQLTITTPVKSIAVAALLGTGVLFALAGDAHAQVRKPQITGNIVADTKANLAPKAASQPAAAAPTGLAKFMNDLANLQKTVVDNVVADITAADADAATLTNPNDPTSFRDPISHACYPAAIKFLSELPAATAPTGTLIGVQLFQKKRDFIMQIQAGLPTYLKLGCSPLLGDEAAVFTKLMGLVGINVALNTLIPGAGALASLPL